MYTAPVAAAAEPTDSAVRLPESFAKDRVLTLETTPLMLADGDEKSWDQRSGNKWFYQSYLAIWAASVNGTVANDQSEVDIDIGFSDIMDASSIAVGLNFEAGQGPWSVLFFGQYLGFEHEGETRNGFDANVEAVLAIVDVAGTYQIWETSLGEDSKLAVDALLGLRYTHLGTEVDIDEGPLAGAHRERNADIVDPYVGARVRYYLDRNWEFQALGTAGGFGVGSDFAWSMLAMAEYRFTRKISAVVGYRAIGYDYTGDNDFEWDVTMHGPVLGLSFRW
jgi:hypothetical protein